MWRFLVLLLLLLGCSPAPPRPVTFDDLRTPAPLDGESVIVEGYPGVVRKETRDEPGKQTFMVTLYPANVTGENPAISATAAAGTDPGQVEPLKDGYTIRDLKIHCADGSLATFTDRVRVEGTVKVYFGTGVNIEAARLEKLPPSK